MLFHSFLDIYVFQSTLPRGSDIKAMQVRILPRISIHAPSRERPWYTTLYYLRVQFQSTLPRGSDFFNFFKKFCRTSNFNPRSLAGATILKKTTGAAAEISIHAPSRERPPAPLLMLTLVANFNPRSLAGATVARYVTKKLNGISIHAPSRERPTPG